MNMLGGKKSPLAGAFARIGKPIVAMEIVIERILTAILAGGHVLLEGPPGTGKTLVASAVARAVGLPFGRIQFTVDLLPSDILGTEVYRQSDGSFTIREGPVFCNVLLADEINRAAPRVQSALLQAMQERHVTLGGKVLSLPTPFIVLATQNPMEHAGTFELPSAQLDRFMLCHRVDFPGEIEERQIVAQNLKLGLQMKDGKFSTKTEFGVIDEKAAKSAVTNAEVAEAEEEASENIAWNLQEMMIGVQAVSVPDTFTDHCVRLVRKTRTHRGLELGCGPRATLALVRAAQARAFLLGRDRVALDDLFELAADVLLHRMRISLAAMSDDKTPRIVLNEIMEEFASVA